MALAAAGDVEGALQACAGVLERDPFYLPAIDLTLDLLIHRGDGQGALVVAQTALAEGMESFTLHNTLGLVAKARGEAEEALARFALAQAQDPAEGDTALRRAIMLLERDDPAQAGECLLIHCEAVPDDPGAWLQAATVLTHFNHPQVAAPFVHSYARLSEPGAERDHRLAALGAGPMPARQSAQMVRQVFDKNAAGYDANLAALDNRGVELAREALAAVLGAGSGDLVVVDAGCGTGLVGPVLRPYARQLIGIDLSPAILAEAEARGVYDTLAEGDVTAMPLPEGQVDLIYCADVLTYLGDLAPVLDSFARALSPAGRVIISTEPPPAGAGEVHLGPSGRYAHSGDYLRKLSESAGLAHETLFAGRALRLEYGHRVRADVTLLSRPFPLD
ncbi:methyltransferase domain-containing protein [Alphaproteobacteria bacterium KMM 3653]|uniref:Methyltransferase domain-containing protein n=1 Tax=Harenicola maris TaxID=2841044 RepID=A0AAP2G3A1_9RHOB|nr:methyltransferase domain-containing protein [Harenicola maris]